MTAEETIKTEAMAHSTLGKNHRGEVLYDTKAYESFIEGAKSERNKTIDEAIQLLSLSSAARFMPAQEEILNSLKI